MDLKKRKMKGKTPSTPNNSDMYLKKHVGLIHCENKLTLIQRKICNILLFNALDKIHEQDIHEIPIKQLCSLVGYNSNDTKLIKDSIKSLISTVLEWNLLEDSKFINENDYPEDLVAWNASALLAGASIKRGVVQYSYSPQIKPVLSSLDIYGRINLFVQSKFNSTYSLVLYENCVRFKNINQTAWFSLSLFRSLMGISENKYGSFKELNRNVITVAVNEINQKSDIRIEAQYKKSGRTIVAIQFSIADNQGYQPSFRKPQSLSIVNSVPELGKELSLVDILISEYYISERQAKRLVKDYEHAYIMQKINLIKSKKNIKHMGAYLISALLNDYQAENKEDKAVKVKIAAPEVIPMREAKAAYEITSLKNKYMAYKLKAFTNFISRQTELMQTKIHDSFVQYLQPKTQIFNTFQKKKLASPFVMVEFLTFLENRYSEVIGDYMSFDDYITAEDIC